MKACKDLKVMEYLELDLLNISQSQYFAASEKQKCLKAQYLWDEGGREWDFRWEMEQHIWDDLASLDLGRFLLSSISLAFSSCVPSPWKKMK